MNAMKKLNARERRFVGEYLIDCDPKRAALAAGYSKTMAATKAYQWVSNGKGKPHVFVAVQKALEKHLQKLEISAERVLREIALLGFANIEDYIVHENSEITPDFSKVTRDQMAAVQEVTVDQYAGGTGDGKRKQVTRIRFKLADKGLNLERLGRYLKLFTEKVEVLASDEILAAIAEGGKRVAAWKARHRQST